MIPLPSPRHRGIDRYSIALIAEPASIAALLRELRQLSEGRDGYTFVTLDDLGQCLYTSGHAVGSLGLDGGVECPDDDSPDSIARYEADRFAAIHASLSAAESPENWRGIPEGFVTDADDVDALLRINRDPSCVLDSVHVVQNVPASDVIGVVAGIPNGYFGGDWNPFQTLSVVRRLHDLHGYAAVGIGARALAFHRSADGISPEGVDALIADLQHLYGHAESPAWRGMAEFVRLSPLLVLGYTEDFAELAEVEHP